MENLREFNSLKIDISDNNKGTLSLNLYKLGRIVFGTVTGRNFQCEVLHKTNLIPVEYLPCDIVALNFGNSYNDHYFMNITSDGIIGIYGNNTILNNMAFRNFMYFTSANIL